MLHEKVVSRTSAGGIRDILIVNILLSPIEKYRFSIKSPGRLHPALPHWHRSTGTTLLAPLYPHHSTVVGHYDSRELFLVCPGVPRKTREHSILAR